MKGNIKGKPGFLKGNNKRFLVVLVSPVKLEQVGDKEAR